MAKPGDTVRYLSAVGGGKITRIEGQMAYVDEDGFETPVLLKELVVVMPAGHDKESGKSRLMFDQKAFDAGRAPAAEQKKETAPAAEILSPAPETSHGNRLNLTIAFEPVDIKNLSKTSFGVVLVNDSNYHLRFSALKQGAESRDWKLLYEGEVYPNELIDIATIDHGMLPEMERIAVQCIAWKDNGEFELKAPVNAVRKLDLTKFYKLHCFRKSIYFDSPVIEFPLVSDDHAVGVYDASEVIRSASSDSETLKLRSELASKFNIEKKQHKKQPHRSPSALLPLIEVDLHIHELTDTTAGMQPKDMLAMQLDAVRRTMNAHKARIGQKIVFIHGKGDGVLRKAVLELLKREYPYAELQDASFQEYGFGATLVTIHQDRRK